MQTCFYTCSLSKLDKTEYLFSFQNMNCSYFIDVASIHSSNEEKIKLVYYKISISIDLIEIIYVEGNIFKEHGTKSFNP